MFFFSCPRLCGILVSSFSVVFWLVCFVLHVVCVHVVCGMLYAIRFIGSEGGIYGLFSCPRLSGILVSSFRIMFELVCFVLYVVCISSCSIVICCMLYFFVGSEGWNYGLFSHVLVWVGFWSVCLASCFDLFVLSCVLYVSVHAVCGMLYVVRVCWFWRGNLWPFFSCPRLSGVLVSLFSIMFWLVCFVLYVVCISSCSVWYLVCCAFLLVLKEGLACLICLVCCMYLLCPRLSGILVSLFGIMFDVFALSCMLYVSVHVVCCMLYAMRFCWFWRWNLWHFFLCPRLSGILVCSFSVMFWLVRFVLYVVCLSSCSVWYVVCCVLLLVLNNEIIAFFLMSSFEWYFGPFSVMFDLFAVSCMLYVPIHVVCGMLYAVRLSWLKEEIMAFFLMSSFEWDFGQYV